MSNSVKDVVVQQQADGSTKNKCTPAKRLQMKCLQQQQQQREQLKSSTKQRLIVDMLRNNANLDACEL